MPGETGVFEMTNAGVIRVRPLGVGAFNYPTRLLDGNGDGLTDIVMALPSPVEPDRWRLHLYLGTGQGFVHATTQPDLWRPEAFGLSFVADSDGDGADELYIPDWSESKATSPAWLAAS